VELGSIAGHTGFQAITVPPEMYFTARREGFSDNELRDRLIEAGVAVSVIDPLTAGLPGIPDPSLVAPQLRSFLQHTATECFEAANALGAGVVNVAHFLGSRDDTDALGEAVAALCAEAGAYGLDIALEFIPGTGFPDLLTTAAIIDGIGVPNLGLTVDTWHFYRSGGKVEDLEKLTVPVMSVQLNDATVDDAAGAYTPMVDRRLPGTGTLPLARIVELLLPHMTRARVGVEVFSGDLRRMPQASAAAAALEATWLAIIGRRQCNV
jgi:sugar phosphate isomerase/epimerase